ncbi:MAG: ABC-2 transporter permease [Oscillospiraceae bacterium]
MKGLILKDILNLKSYLKIFALILLANAAIFIPQGDSSFMAGFPVLISTMLVITTMSYDDMAKWDKYALTMPLTRKEIVLSKYFVMVGFSVAGAITGLLLSIGSSFIIKEVAVIDTLSTVGVVLSIALIFGSVILPLLYKFGVEKARLMIILCALVPTGVVVLFSQVFKNSGMPVPSEALIKNILLMISIVSVIAVIVSFFFSLKIYSNKDF